MGAEVDEAFIRRAVELADLAAVRVALYQATHDPEVESLGPVAKLSPEDREKLISKAVRYLRDDAGVTLERPAEDELRHLMEMATGIPMTEQEFQDHCRQCYWQMRAQMDQVQKEFQLDSFPRFDWDQWRGELVFSSGGTPKVVARIQVIGTVT